MQMKTKLLKKMQRRINKDIRVFNEAIKEDDVLRGRFSAKQVDRKRIPHHDGSGFSLLIFIQMKDNETGRIATTIIEDLPFTTYHREFFTTKLLVEMSWFISFVFENCCSMEV